MRAHPPRGGTSPGAGSRSSDQPQGRSRIATGVGAERPSHLRNPTSCLRTPFGLRADAPPTAARRCLLAPRVRVRGQPRESSR